MLWHSDLYSSDLTVLLRLRYAALLTCDCAVRLVLSCCWNLWFDSHFVCPAVKTLCLYPELILFANGYFVLIDVRPARYSPSWGSLGGNGEQWEGPTTWVTVCCCELYAVLCAAMMPWVDAWSLLRWSSLQQVRQVCSKYHLLPTAGKLLCQWRQQDGPAVQLDPALGATLLPAACCPLLSVSQRDVDTWGCGGGGRWRGLSTPRGAR